MQTATLIRLGPPRRNTVVCGIGLAAVAMLVAVQHVAAGESWRVADQPELKEALQKAPVLQIEPLGKPARGVNVWERWMVPNLDGQSWDVLQIYFKEYYGPTWLCAIDLGTGQVKKQRLADGHQFYLSGRALGVDGKYYIARGMIPAWYLVAVNLKTGEEKVLLESPTERVMDIIERFPSAFARVPQERGVKP